MEGSSPKTLILNRKGCINPPAVGEMEAHSNSVLALALYIVMAASMCLVEKMALNYHDDPLLLIIVEVSVSLLVLIPFVFRVHFFELKMLSWLPTAMCFAGSMVLGKFALGSVTLGTISILKMVRPIITLATEALFFKNAQIKIGPYTIPALTIIFTGSFVYAMERGFQGELAGIMMMGGAIILSTIDRLWCRYLLVETSSSVSNTGVMVIYYVFTLIAALVAYFTREKAIDTLDVPDWNEQRGLRKLSALTWAAACLINSPAAYSRVFAQREASTTTFMVANNISKILIFVFGILVLHETYKFASKVGAALVVLGAIWYMYDRHVVEDKATKRYYKSSKVVNIPSETESSREEDENSKDWKEILWLLEPDSDADDIDDETGRRSSTDTKSDLETVDDDTSFCHGFTANDETAHLI